VPIRDFLPKRIRSSLWGDRDRWGLVPVVDDSCWQEWQKTYADFYQQNQREGVGTRVNDAGYEVMGKIDLTGKRVLEIGAGDIRHMKFWQGTPKEYLLADISSEMMAFARKRMEQRGIAYRTLFVSRNQTLALEENSVDVIVSFYSLEHLYPLRPYLAEFKRVLKPGGCLIGAIPTEGGLAWGGGRMLTSRRWFKKNTEIDPDKIICWEHPNFADQVLLELDQVFSREAIEYWPLPSLPFLDVNLVIRLLHRKAVGR
jgi:ubiquinone/menaquinone biosynthesis C-methylase UbiE